MIRFALIIVLGPWLGHGRRVEHGLILVDVVYLAMLVFSRGGVGESQATRDLLAPYLLTAPLTLIALIAGCGLWFNIVGIRGSRVLRFLGGFLHAFLYLWSASKYYDAGATATWGFSFVAGMGLYGAFSVMVMAAAGRPRPGAPGAL